MLAHRSRGVRSATLVSVALVLALALACGGCGVFGGGGSSGETSPGASTDAPSPGTGGQSAGRRVATSTPAPGQVPAGLSGYYRQRLSWTSCRGSLQCSTLRVPLDYARPRGRSIGLALLRVPALQPRRRVGSMVVDPGGPGASGVDYAAAAAATYGRAIRDVYDVVGFDPRGVGRSAPVQCESDGRLSRLAALDPDPDTPAEIATADRMYEALGRGCLRHDAELTRHVSTREVSRDLDVLRSALGDRRLTYFGSSYGTAIGAAYAARFPSDVGRMVLDGAVDPAAGTVSFNLVQAHGFEVALRSFVGACVRSGGCFLGPTVEDGVGRIQRFLAGVERHPLSSGTGAVTAGTVEYGTVYPLYSRALWPLLDRALQQGFRGNGSLLLLLADGYLHRDSDGRFRDNSFEAYFAVSCLDNDDGLASARLPRYLPRFERASPTFGRAFAYSTTVCRHWPVHSGVTAGPVHVTQAPPVLVVGTTRDPATPLVWARSLSRQIRHSVLVTRDGDGHTGYGQGSTCVDDTVERYLVEGTVPTEDVTCEH